MLEWKFGRKIGKDKVEFPNDILHRPLSVGQTILVSLASSSTLISTSFPHQNFTYLCFARITYLDPDSNSLSLISNGLYPEDYYHDRMVVDKDFCYKINENVLIVDDPGDGFLSHLSPDDDYSRPLDIMGNVLNVNDIVCFSSVSTNWILGRIQAIDLNDNRALVIPICRTHEPDPLIFSAVMSQQICKVTDQKVLDILIQERLSSSEDWYTFRPNARVSVPSWIQYGQCYVVESSQGQKIISLNEKTNFLTNSSLNRKYCFPYLQLGDGISERFLNV